jgi:outer membrane protein OmpA-like peptidoglycan-associated protein
MHSEADRLNLGIMIAALCLILAIPVHSQESGKAANPNTKTISASRTPIRLTTGQSAIFQGAIVKRIPDGFTLRDFSGALIQVSLKDGTVIKERKINPFRGARNYGVTELLPGLKVEVKGNGSSSGELEASEIQFTQDDLRLANILTARVIPVEERLDTGEARMSRTEENAQRLSGQISEVSSVSNAARSSAKAAQDTADSAVESAKQANEAASNAKAGVRATNDRITALDDFEAKTSLIVNFKVNSSVLSVDAKGQLDKFAEAAKSERGFIIEVAGFASADGDESANRILSQKRADAVIQYLAENHGIPLRRFITPFGYGEKMPMGDNQTRDGRTQNRRVEARILVSKGQVQEPASMATAR